jgi:thioredoxin-like negative regulator of GroEL
MNGKLTDADLMVLVNALLNRLKFFDTVSSLSEIEILIENLAQAPDIDPTEDAAVFLARQELVRGLYRSAAMRICKAVARRLNREH